MKCSNVPGRKKGKRNERKGKEEKERKRGRNRRGQKEGEKGKRDRMEWYIGRKEEKCAKRNGVVDLLPGRKIFLSPGYFNDS